MSKLSLLERVKAKIILHHVFKDVEITDEEIRYMMLNKVEFKNGIVN